MESQYTLEYSVYGRQLIQFQFTRCLRRAVMCVCVFVYDREPELDRDKEFNVCVSVN